jgi:hypothetical protein
MNPNTVFSASLVTSLVLWFPSMQACLRGDLDLAPAGLRYLAALAVSRLAVGFLARLVSAYRAAQHHDSIASEDAPSGPSPTPSAAASPAADAGAPHRRRSDGTAGDDSDTTLAA